MKVKFRGYCSGTETRMSQKTGKPYQITKFVEVGTLDDLEIFGDLGLVAHEEPRDYEIIGKITGFEFPKVLVNGKEVDKVNQAVDAPLPLKTEVKK